MAALTPTKLVLENYWRSSCSWRVRILLAHKSLDFKYVAVNLLKGEDCDAAYWAKNPSGVPTLIDGDVTLGQSLAIMEYLEEKYPAQPMLPKALGDRAVVRSIALFIASGIQPLQNLGTQQKVGKRFGNDQKAGWTADVITEGMTGLEELLKQHAGLCCFGDALTMADAALVPQCFAAKRFGCDFTQFPTILRVYSHLETLDAVKLSHPDKMPDAVVPQ
jgi:maleylacetoacetate isomerase